MELPLPIRELPVEDRTELLNEAGYGRRVVVQAIDKWQDGEQLEALQMMRDDGAEAEWMAFFVEKMTGRELDIKDLLAVLFPRPLT